MTRYRPTLDSFLRSFIYGASPLIGIGLVYYFSDGKLRTPIWIGSGIMVLISLSFLLPAVFVHATWIEVGERGVRVGSLGRPVRIAWQEVTSALLRERENAVTRTDRMFLLDSADGRLIFHPSTLRPADEEALLAFIREHVRLVVQRDAPGV